jgi:H+/gluconate symporter-like permease
MMSPSLIATMPGGALGIVGLSVVFIVVAIAVLRLHAFFALILAGVFVAMLSGVGGGSDKRFSDSVEAVMTEFGSTTG